MQKEMCENNSRAEQIKSVLSEHLGRAITLNFQIAGSTQEKAQPAARKPKSSSQRKNRIINDPAVKTVLLGLNATITDIEEDSEAD
jgi:hypothetical protein